MLNESYWNNRYIEGNIGWDAGSVTTPIKQYIDQVEDKNLRILIPGAGFGNEAGYIYSLGFVNTFVCEWSEKAVIQFKKNYPSFPDSQIFLKNFFEIEGDFDLIIEQTFFCAIHPSQRELYAKKVFDLLNFGGKMVGLLFDFPFSEKGPPFGGDSQEYLSLFKKYFKINCFEKSYNSIKPREGNEIFFNFEKTNYKLL